MEYYTACRCTVAAALYSNARTWSIAVWQPRRLQDRQSHNRHRTRQRDRSTAPSAACSLRRFVFVNSAVIGICWVRVRTRAFRSSCMERRPGISTSDFAKPPNFFLCFLVTGSLGPVYIAFKTLPADVVVVALVTVVLGNKRLPLHVAGVGAGDQ